MLSFYIIQMSNSVEAEIEDILGPEPHTDNPETILIAKEPSSLRPWFSSIFFYYITIAAKARAMFAKGRLRVDLARAHMIEDPKDRESIDRQKVVEGWAKDINIIATIYNGYEVTSFICSMLTLRPSVGIADLRQLLVWHTREDNDAALLHITWRKDRDIFRMSADLVTKYWSATAFQHDDEHPLIYNKTHGQFIFDDFALNYPIISS
jgi:hypothetical protein